MYWAKFTGESCKCTLQAQSAPPAGAKVQFLGNRVLLACVLRATTKKGRQLFQGRKVHPRENPRYAYVCIGPLRSPF